MWKKTKKERLVKKRLTPKSTTFWRQPSFFKKISDIECALKARLDTLSYKFKKVKAFID